MKDCPRLLFVAALLTGFAGESLAATFVVNTTGDKTDNIKGDGLCADSDGNCSLRAAIEESNALAGTDTINFGIPGAGVHTITPLSGLPQITDPVIIDGTTQAGYAGSPLIELSGTSASSANGLNISAGSSTIKGLCINRFGNGIVVVANGGNTLVGNFVGIGTDGNTAQANGANGIFLGSAGNTVGGTAAGTRNVVSGNASTGIAIDSTVYGFPAGGNTIQGNRIGTNASGTVKVANGGNGVFVNTSGNAIGGTAANAGNIVSGNALPGIALTGSGATGNHIEGNIIGLEVTGSTKLGNTQEGVVIVNGASSNFVGGTATGARNVISGSATASGISIVGLAVTGNSVLGNYIGTDKTGALNMGNAGNGIFLEAPNNTIGGVLLASANVIAGNAFPGLFIATSNGSGNSVQGNLVGVNVTGAALPNSKGIVIDAAPNNTIGGSTAGAGNTISGNTSYGIEIRNAGATGNTVKGNFIGTNSADTLDRHNSGDGILINLTSGNVIGGTAAGEGNAISYNLGNGVRVTGSTAVHNAIRGNAIHDNTGIGIDLGGDGVTLNDAGDGDSGPNDLMNFPEGVTATWDKDQNQTVLRGHLDAASPATAAIDLFANSKKDASDHGQGEKYLGTATPDADGFFCLTVAGQLPFVAGGPPPPSGTVVPPPWVSATATSAAGSTSEFSPTNNAVELIGLEVNQAVQDWTNSVVLIQDKTTYVRAHIQTTDPTSTPVSVTIQLRGFRAGSEIAGSPLTALNYGGFQAKPHAASRRKTFGASLNFRLPDSWLNGTLELRLERTDGILACKEAADAGAPPGTGCSNCRVQVTFEKGSTIPVNLLLIQWRDGLGTIHEWDDAHVDALIRRLVAIYPIASLNDVTRGEVFYSPPSTPVLSLVNGSLENRRMLDGCDSGAGCQRYYYGVVKDTNSGGLANQIPGTVASGLTEANPTTYYRNAHAHEIAHILGQAHATSFAIFGACKDGGGIPIPNTQQGACGECADNPPQGGVFPNFFNLGGTSYATLGPLLSGEDAKVFGVDTSTIPEPTAIDPLQQFELMSYCNVGIWKWISDFTYKGIHADIKSAFPPSGPTHAAAVTVQDSLVFRGTINPVDDATRLGTVQRLPASAAPAPPPAGPYTLELRNGTGGVISQTAFKPTADVPESPSSPPSPGRFLIAVPANVAIRQALILKGTTVLASRTASPNTPTVQVVYPNGGENVTQDPVNLQWNASDGDGDPMTYVVQYSPNNGSSWETLALDLPTKSFSVARRLLKGTSSGLLRVIVSDGFNTAVDQSDAVFTVGNHAPRVSLLTPTAGQAFAGNQQMVFEGAANDIEDGALSGSSLQWTSSLNGPLGAGRTLLKTANQLSAGSHTITLTATDSGSLQSTASVTISVGSTPSPTYADLSLTQTASPEKATAGSSLIYTLTVTNEGKDTATGVTLTDTLPGGAAFGSANPTQGSCGQSSGTVTCNLGSLPADGTATVTITVTPSAPASIQNSATVAAGQVDPAPANNSSTESTTVWPAPPSVSAPASQNVCPGGSAVQSVTASGSAPLSYRWRKNGADLFDGGGVSGSATATLTINPAVTSDSGSYDADVTDGYGQTVTSAEATLTVASPSAAIAAPSAVCQNAQGMSASVPSAGPGATYAWSIVNGAITAGAGTATITFSAGSTGSVQLNVTVTDSHGCGASGGKSVSIVAGACGSGYHTLTPCRVADTRDPAGPSGGPALAANAARTFPVANLCQIPATAKAVAINLAVFLPDSGGDLRVYPAGGTAPLASAINFRPGIVRANNAVVPLGAGGQISVQCDMASPTGSTHFFFDVFGYFE